MRRCHAGILRRASTVPQRHRQVRHQPGPGRHLLVSGGVGVTRRVHAHHRAGRAGVFYASLSLSLSLSLCFVSSK